MSDIAERLHHAPDLLVIGLGHSGIAALEAAHSLDLNAIGVERNPIPPNGGIAASQYDTRVWGIFPDGTVACTGERGTALLSPRAVIIATGMVDMPLPVPGWHLPGATGVWHGARTLATDTSVVVLRGPHAGAGQRAPDLSEFSILHDQRLSDGRPIEILGGDSVEGIRIGDVAFQTGCVMLDNGPQTENLLARMAGIPSLFSPLCGGDVITPGQVFTVGGTLISVIGSAASVGYEPDVTIQEARTTAITIADRLNGGDIPCSISVPRAEPDRKGTPLLPMQATPETLACPDEGVTIAQIRNAIEQGAMTVNDVKRRTRAAMATCQGRDCLWTIRALLAAHGRDFATPMTARPPAIGITLHELALLAEG